MHPLKRSSAIIGILLVALLLSACNPTPTPAPTVPVPTVPVPTVPVPTVPVPTVPVPTVPVPTVPVPTVPVPVQCIEFEDLTVGDTYQVMDLIINPTQGTKIRILPFQWSNGDWTYDGHAVVGDAGEAGVSGNEMFTNNVNLDFDFGYPIAGLTVNVADFGGNLNIEINGEFVNFEDFPDIDNKDIGGVHVSVDGDFVSGNYRARLTLEGAIVSFAIGGQELFIDYVCPME